MGRSVTVLDWTDIQSLVRICTYSFPSDNQGKILESTRHRLLDSFLPFFQRWQPEGLMEDELRRPLVKSLEALSEILLPERVNAWLASLVESDPTLVDIGQECRRIASLVRAAITSDDEDGDVGIKPPGVLTALLIFLASQGDALSAGLRSMFRSPHAQSL